MKFFVLILLILGLTLTQSTPVAKKVEKRTALESSKADIPPKAWNPKDETLKSENSKSGIPKVVDLKIEKDEIKNEHKDVKKIDTKDELSPENESETEEVDREKKSCKTMTSQPTASTKICLEILAPPSTVEICDSDPIIPPIPVKESPEVCPEHVGSITVENHSPPIITVPSPPVQKKIICFEVSGESEIPFVDTQSTQIPAVQILPQNPQGYTQVQPQKLPELQQYNKMQLHFPKPLHQLFSIAEGQNQGGLQTAEPVLFTNNWSLQTPTQPGAQVVVPAIQGGTQGGSQRTQCTCFQVSGRSATENIVPVSNHAPALATSIVPSLGGNVIIKPFGASAPRGTVTIAGTNPILQPLTIQRPTISVLKSGITAQQPAISIQQPAISVQQPAISVQQPAISVQQPTTVVHQQPTMMSSHISGPARAMDVSWGPVMSQGFRYSRVPETDSAQHEHTAEAEKTFESQNSGPEDKSNTQMSSSHFMFPQSSLTSDNTKIDEDNLNMRNYDIQRTERQSFMNGKFEDMDGMGREFLN